jgi:hypothetical protein
MSGKFIAFSMYGKISTTDLSSTRNGNSSRKPVYYIAWVVLGNC